MKFLINRTHFKDTYTIGDLEFDREINPSQNNWEFLCNTLEDKYRDLTKEAKVPGETCIPNGTYSIKMEYSPHFNRLMPHIQNVPFFSYIMIHPGNTDADTSGCVLVGDNKEPGKVLDSVKSFTKFMYLLLESNQSDWKLTITGTPLC